MNEESPEIFIYGAGGHAKVVIDLVEKEGKYRVSCLVDDDPRLQGKNFYGYPVLGGREVLQGGRMPSPRGIVAIGENRARLTVCGWLEENGFRLVSAVHPAARMARGVQLGRGTVVMAGAVVNSDSHIGNFAIVNTRASVDHDCMVGDGVHLAPGTTLCGAVTVGDETFVGAGATVIPNITLGARVVVGAGAVVLKDVADGLTVVGNPAAAKREKGNREK